MSLRSRGRWGQGLELKKLSRFETTNFKPKFKKSGVFRMVIVVVDSSHTSGSTIIIAVLCLLQQLLFYWFLKCINEQDFWLGCWWELEFLAENSLYCLLSNLCLVQMWIPFINDIDRAVIESSIILFHFHFSKAIPSDHLAGSQWATGRRNMLIISSLGLI